MSNEAVTITLQVNGREESVSVEPRRSLADVLREQLGLTGTRLGCEHGSCGTCTVLIDGVPARSCLAFAVQVADGQHIETVESLASEGKLSDLQQAFLDHHALQCGFCTSGFLMVGEELRRRDPQPTEAEIRDALSANLCRCTGYTPIERAVSSCLAADRAGDV
jgi:carbon-monoxide dehydrogenase small subunit